MEKKYKRKEEGFELTAKRMNNKQDGELEVTGVSRSGRVRKKSSKLMDFENLDEIDIRANANKKKEKGGGLASVGRPKKDPQQHLPVKEEVFSDEDLGDTSAPYSKQEPLSDESDHEMAYPPQEESSMESGSDMEDVDNHGMDHVENQGFQSIAGETDYTHTNQQQSLYMMEKASSKKKLVIKDGKIVGRMKAQEKKKDKATAKLSAYMLWAKEMRQELSRSKPQLDFSQTSKKLGELWATVPMHEKYIWKRRAKRVADSNAAKIPNSGGRGPHHQQQQQQQQQQQHHQVEKKMKSPVGRKFINKAQKERVSPPAVNNMLAISPSPEKGTPKSHTADQNVYKAVGTTPLDVAAHIRLLGESLSIIGERLAEHEGQMVVSGSFSVLLDSILCVLAPLMCLTQQVPQMNVIPQEQLSVLMDNIAYIMPGL